jgi:hypothetical protein
MITGNKAKAILSVAILSIAASAVVFFVSGGVKDGKPEAFLPSGYRTIGEKPMFFDQGNFNDAVASAESIKPENDIRAIIVPHHLVPSRFLAGMFKRASGRQIDTVMIIGPNHFNVGAETMTTALAEWETPYGKVKSDAVAVGKLAHSLGLGYNGEAFENEHSVGAMLPFIKYYLPRAGIVPVILSSYAGEKEAHKLSDWLKDNIDGNTLVVYSIDFSHYLAKDRADENDLVTESLMRDGEVGKILRLGNDFVDSPATLAASLLSAKDKNLRLEIVYRGNSFDFLADKPSLTTSYFGIAFRDPE